MQRHVMKKKKKAKAKKATITPEQELLFAQALEQHQAGNLAEAEALYRRLVLAAPAYAQAAHLLGVLRMQLGDLAQARELIARAVELEPANAMARYNLGMAHEKSGELEQAVEQYRRAVRIDPEYTAAWRVLGDVLCLTEAYGEAVKAYKRVLEKMPEDLGTLNNLGNACVSLGSFENARKCFEGVLEREPGHAPTRNNLAGVLRELDQWDEAVAQYEKAIELDPKLAAAHLGLADLFSKRGELRQAETLARRALELSPGPDAWFRIGYIRQQLGDGEEAGACYERALEYDPSHTVALNNLGTLAKDSKAYENSIGFFQQAIALDPAYWEAWTNLANAYEKTGDLVKAEEAARKGVECEENGRSVLRLAYVLQQAGRIEEAKQQYARVLELEPADKLGVTLYLAGLGMREVPDKAPSAHVRQLFDNYAGSFDAHLLEKLEYKGPEVVLTALQPWLENCPETAGSQHASGLDILDLGCGTGLCGIALRPFARRLDGVDLSPKMIANARERDVYDHLEVNELTDYLEGCGREYDIAAAGDVFVYIGELEPVFRAVHKRLRTDGAFVFTVEEQEGPGDGFVLGEANRYAHTQDYIRGLAARTGYDVRSLEQRSTRQESLKPVPCLVAVLTPGE